MFTGIIKNTGIVKKIIFNKKEMQIGIKSGLKLSNKDLGSSINCSGVCLTLENIYQGLYFFYISRETLKISNFKNIKLNHIINLEKSLDISGSTVGTLPKIISPLVPSIVIISPSLIVTSPALNILLA